MNDDFSSATDPDTRNVIPRRIVEVTDQDDTILAEFIELDPVSPYLRRAP